MSKIWTVQSPALGCTGLSEGRRRIIRIQAGPNGSIQGPAEAKWGYTVLNVADWDHDGLLDVIINSIWGKICWYKNVGTATKPVLAAQQPIEVAWEGATPKPAWFWWNPKERCIGYAMAHFAYGV